MKAVFFAWVTSIDGDVYETRSYAPYGKFERIVNLYRRAPDCVKVDAYRRLACGKPEFIGSFKRLAPPVRKR